MFTKTNFRCHRDNILKGYTTDTKIKGSRGISTFTKASLPSKPSPGNMKYTYKCYHI